MANNLNSGATSPTTIVPKATEGLTDYFKYIKRTKYYYAQTVNAQINPNQTVQNIRWKDMSKAVGKDNGGAYSEYTYKKDKKGNVTYNHPWKVTAHDYELNLPSNAHINQIKVQVYMRTDKDGSGKSHFPDCGFYINPKHNVMISKMGSQDGWQNGTYWAKSSKKVTKSWTHAEYIMDGETFNSAGYTVDMLNNTYWGVDLSFNQKCATHTVYLGYVRVQVEYYVPTYTLIHNGTDTSMDAPRQLRNTGNVQSVKFTLEQKTIANGGKQCFELKLPFGTELVGVSPSNGIGHWYEDTNRWVVNCNGKTKESLTVQFIDYTVDLQSIDLDSVTCAVNPSIKAGVSKKFYFYTNLGVTDDYGQVTTRLITKKPHYRDTCCFAVTSKVRTSQDNYITFSLHPTFSYEGITEDNKVEYTLDDALTTDGVTIINALTNNNEVTFHCPNQDEDYNIAFSICLRPLSRGNKCMEVRVEGGTNNNQVCFNIADPYEYHFSTKTVDTDTRINIPFMEEDIGFFNHRIASELETGAYILPCRVKESDSLMTMDKPNIHMYRWEQLDYIGCVPLEHLHFDPKSTYKDKLLDTHYKNKRYMGKELASDEDITLNVRLHPQQVTTIQGLIDMDKPIPINANHRIWEGDALNHRGWAEIYAISTTKTNPNWYKCDIDVKYLTHNLNTRFKILKGDKTFGNYTMPNLMLESVASGDALSGGDQNIDYFTVTTDGGYIFNQEEIKQDWYRNEDGKLVIYIVENSDEEMAEIEAEFEDEEIEFVIGETEAGFEELLERIINEGYILVDANIGRPIVVDDTEYSNENQRNIFTLDEGQFFNIRSREPLSNISEVKYIWASTMIEEYKENAISKIVRLVDATNNIPMLEYEYSDFNFDDYDDSTTNNQQIECHVIARKYVKGDYTEVINEDIKIPINVLSDEDDPENTMTMYGSTLTFRLNNKTLTIEDDGYSGKAINTSTELEGTSYYYEVEWKNRNTDGEDNDITTYVDLVVQDSLLASQYASKYGNMLVSPFPVKDKRVIFTRNGEEGVIYYYDNDGEEFSYLIEPYYQYHNGVDLRTSQGTSIFNLNYGYRTVYLENGLVSMGINRLNGQMYLRKWDNDAKQYVTLFYFQLQHYDDVNINNISDDRIELQASNTVISMYRGHPYVILKHDIEDISILNGFGRVWGEEVGDSVYGSPTYFDLLNTQNMLPACVGGTKTLNDECTRVYECGYTVNSELDEDLCKIYDLEDGDTFQCPDLIDTHIELDLDEPIYEGNLDTILKVSGDLNNDDIVYFIVDGDVVDTPSTFEDGLSYVFDESRAYTVSAVFIGDDERSHAVAPPKTIMVEQVEITPQPTPPTPTPTPDPCPHPESGKYKLKMETPLKFKYMDGQKIKIQLTRGGHPVCGETIEMIDFAYINSELTRRDGYIRQVSNNHYKSVPKKYKIGARYYQGGNLITKVFKDVEISKADVLWEVNRYARSPDGYFSVQLKNKHNHNIVLKNTQVTVYINGKANTKKTNENGNVNFKIPKRGNYKYKCVFAGNSNYNKGEASFKETVRNNG